MSDNKPNGESDSLKNIQNRELPRKLNKSVANGRDKKEYVPEARLISISPNQSEPDVISNNRQQGSGLKPNRKRRLQQPLRAQVPGGISPSGPKLNTPPRNLTSKREKPSIVRMSGENPVAETKIERMPYPQIPEFVEKAVFELKNGKSTITSVAWSIETTNWNEGVKAPATPANQQHGANSKGRSS